MKKNVIVVAHPETGAIVTANERNPEYGKLRVDQTIAKMEGGFLNKSNRSAFIGGKLADLLSLGLKAGDQFPGQIVRSESTAPFYEGQKAKINPSTNETVTHEGSPVYFIDEYTEDMSRQDSLLASDKVTIAAEKEA